MANSLVTKNILAESLKTLASQKSYDSITVGEIVKECNLNRQTFYYHFADKDELLEWIFYNQTFLPLTLDIDLNNWDDKIEALLVDMRANKNFYMNTIKVSNLYFEKYLIRMITNLMKKVMMQYSEISELTEEDKELAAKMNAFGLAGIITDWAYRGMIEEEEVLSNRIKKCVRIVEQLASILYETKD